VETYRAGERLAAGALPERYGGERSLATAIYYLLTPDTFSEMHRLRSDEVYHFYLGDPVELLQLRPDGSGELLRLGSDLAAGERPQLAVPRGVWQGSRVVEGGRFALLGCTVAPGFEPDDYEAGARADLTERYPACRDLIAALTQE
jgi:predicted cupin superfamily sugar epimerase